MNFNGFYLFLSSFISIDIIVDILILCECHVVIHKHFLFHVYS